MAIELTKLGERFENAAGVIQNLLEVPCGGVSRIESKAGSSRSHHFHREDGHWLWVERGEMLYLERPVGSKEEPSRRTVKAGELVYTGPMLEHSTYFSVDTVLFSFSLRARTHELHEQDVVRCEPLK